MKKIILLTFAALLVFFSFIAGLYVYFDKEVLELNNETRKNIPGSFIQLSNGYVHYELKGPSTGELVVLIHGAGSGYYAWDKNFYQLADSGYRVLRYDLYGRGFSDRPTVKYDVPFFAAQLLELLDSLQLKQSFHLASVSMGALIATYITYHHPEKVGKLIYIDPAAINNGVKHWILSVPFASDFFMTTYWAPRAVEKQMAEFYQPSSVSEYSINAAHQLKYKGLKRAFVSTWLNACSVNMNKELKVIGKEHSDILLLWGEQDPLTPLQLSEKYKQLLPFADFFVIKDAGHLSNYEKPDLVNPYLLTFLKRP